MKNVKAALRLDYRVRRGAAIGFEPDIVYGKNDSSFAKIRTYFALHQNPTINRTSLPRGSVPDERYRLSLQDRTDFTRDISGFATLTKLSDRYLLQDFFQTEFIFPEAGDAGAAAHECVGEETWVYVVAGERIGRAHV